MSNTIRYFVSFIALGLISSSLGPTLPALAAQTGSSVGQISGLFVARSLGTMVGSLIIGRLYDRFAGHPLLAGSLLAAAIAMAVTPLMTSLYALFVLFLLLGVAAGSINVGGNAMTSFVHGAQVGPFINTLHFTFSLGGAIAPLLVAKFDDQANSLTQIYLLLAILIVPAALLLLPASSPTPHSRTLEHQNRRLPWLPITLFVSFLFLEVGAESSLMGWIFSYASARGMRDQHAAYLNSAFWVAFTLGRLGGALLVLRVRPRLIIIPAIALWIGVAILMLLAPVSPAILWFGAIGFGLVMAPVFPMTFALAQRRFTLDGKVTGFFLAGSAMGGMFWPWLIGQVFNSAGPQSMIVVILIVLLSATVILTIILKKMMVHQDIEAPLLVDLV